MIHPAVFGRRTALAGGAALLAATAGAARAADKRRLEHVATFEGRQVTGVGVAPDGRIFVNFPRWEQDVPVSVAELGRDGALRPYPDVGWNGWRNATPLSPSEHFVCVQSVVVDPTGRSLWVVDPAAPATEFLISGGPKLVRIDLATNQVTRIYPFGPDVAPQGSYLNDVRFSPDAAFAFLTDSGAQGALLMLDTRSGAIRRLLAGHPSTQVEPGVVVHVDGRPLRRPDGRGPQFAADSLTVDRDGGLVYWQALTGRTLYRLPAAAMTDPAQAGQIAEKVEKVATTFPADGYWTGRDGSHYLTSPEDNAVKVRRPGDTFAIVVQDDRLRWPDSMAEGADGHIYVTASHIPDERQWVGGGGVKRTALFRFAPA